MDDERLIAAGRAWMTHVADGNLTGALAAMREALGVQAAAAAPHAHPAPAVAATAQALTPDALLDMAECMRPLLQTPEDWAVALAYGKDVMTCSAAAWGVTLVDATTTTTAAPKA